MLKVKLNGTGVAPEAVPFEDVNDLAEAMHRAITPLLPSSTEQDKIDKTFALTEVKEGSAIYAFASPAPEMQLAYAYLQECMTKNEYDGLPAQTIKQLHQINNFVVKKKYSVVEFIPETSQSLGTVELTKNKLLKLPEENVIECLTSIYGRLMKVGGAKPTAHLLLPNGQGLVCSLKEELAKKIASNIYQDIGLEGKAYWKLPGWELKEFIAFKASIFDSSSNVKSAFAELKKVVDGAYDEVDDVDAFIKKLRGDE